MSIYDQRETPAYRDVYRPYTHRCLEKIWTPDHDAMLKKLIAEWQWYWFWQVTDAVVAMTPPEVMHPFIKKSQNWRNNIMYFAQTRAHQLGYVKAIRKPEWRMCPVCEQRFLENSLPLPLVERLGMDRRNFCAPCLRDSLLSPGDDHLGREEALQYLRDLSTHIGGIPHQGFGGHSGNLDGLNDEERLKLIRLNLRKPSVRRVKELFGSWLQGLIAASVLEDGTRPTVYGTQTVARDGHICFSLGEKTIDDFLYQHGIKHEKEPPYPDSNLRADFRVGDTLIEYFGLTGNPDYDARAEEKKRICKRHDIPMIAIYPQDLAGAQRLRRKLAGLLPDDTYE